MTSTTNNFYKSGNKTKFPNMYAFDGYKTNNGVDSTKGKSSVSPTRIFSLKDFNKTTKNSTYLPMMNSYNNHPYKLMDNDKLQEELINYKNDINKKNKELHNLKIAFIKLDEENKKNVKIIEDIIIEAGRGRGEIAKMSPEELDSEIKNIMAYTHPSDKMILKLKESYIINNLKRQLFEYKICIEAKDEEIAGLKTNGRVAKFHDLEAKMKATIDELITVKNSYNILLNSYNDKEIKAKELLDERDHLKSINQKYKNQFDELKEKIQSFQDLNMKLTEQLRNLDDKNTNSRFQQSAMKNQITDRDKMILSLQEELRSLDKFRLEKEKTEKLISNLTNSVNSLKEDLERKTKKLRELERVNLEMRMPNNDQSEKSGNRNTISENSLDKLRDKVIRTLEIENRKMKDKLKKMNYEHYKNMDNNIENDIGKNVPTNHENVTQPDQNEKIDNNNNEEEIKTPNTVNASADDLNENANNLHESNLINMGLDQEELKENNANHSINNQDQEEMGMENQNASRVGGGENKSQKSRQSRSHRDEEDKIIHKSNLEIENNENNKSQTKQNQVDFGSNDHNQEKNVNSSKINISHVQKNSEIENIINDKSNMENMQKDSNNDNIENIEKIDKNNTFERGDETIKKDVQDILEKLDENMKQIENKEEANEQEENVENNEPRNNENILIDENPEIKANENQAEENNHQLIDDNAKKSAVLNEEQNKILSENAEQDGENLVNLNKSNLAEEKIGAQTNIEDENIAEDNIRENHENINENVKEEEQNERVVENKDNDNLDKSNHEMQMKLSESSQKVKKAEEMVEEQPGYIGN